MTHTPGDLRAASVLALVLTAVGLLVVVAAISQHRLAPPGLGIALLCLGSALALKIRALRRNPADSITTSGTVSAGSEFPKARQGVRSVLLTAALFLCAVPLFVYCAFRHVCMDGHLRHPPYSAWQIANDLVWSALLVCALFVAISQPLRGRWVIATCLCALPVTRIGLHSVGGVLFVAELIVLLLVPTVLVFNLRRPDRSASPSQTVRLS